jgi:hypothetical protein
MAGPPGKVGGRIKIRRAFATKAGDLRHELSIALIFETVSYHILAS